VEHDEDDSDNEDVSEEYDSGDEYEDDYEDKEVNDLDNHTRSMNYSKTNSSHTAIKSEQNHAEYPKADDYPHEFESDDEYDDEDAYEDKAKEDDDVSLRDTFLQALESFRPCCRRERRVGLGRCESSCRAFRCISAIRALAR
jgi:hypothetical protein